jgi:hypothetical protein
MAFAFGTVMAQSGTPDGSMTNNRMLCLRPPGAQAEHQHRMMKTTHEHNHHQGWHPNLLQGVGHGPGRNILARLAS